MKPTSHYIVREYWTDEPRARHAFEYRLLNGRRSVLVLEGTEEASGPYQRIIAGRSYKVQPSLVIVRDRHGVDASTSTTKTVAKAHEEARCIMAVWYAVGEEEGSDV